MTPDNSVHWSTQISRVSRSKSAAQTSYDRLSRFYDRLAGRSEGVHRDCGLRLLAAQEGERILEIGFGTGHGLVALSRAAGASGRVCGIDLSPGMCRVARDRLAQAGLSHAVALSCGDAAALPYPSRSFDALFMSFTLELFDTPEIPHVLYECHRVLAESGRICVVALSRVKVNLPLWLYEVAHAALPSYVDCRPIYARRALAEAGFQISRTIERSMWGLPVEVVLAQTNR